MKPIDKEIAKHGSQSKGRILTIEEHYIEGGIKEAICSALSEEKNLVITGIAVNSIPKSGSP